MMPTAWKHQLAAFVQGISQPTSLTGSFLFAPGDGRRRDPDNVVASKQQYYPELNVFRSDSFD